jgi:hypothetical protein
MFIQQNNRIAVWWRARGSELVDLTVICGVFSSGNSARLTVPVRMKNGVMLNTFSLQLPLSSEPYSVRLEWTDSLGNPQSYKVAEAIGTRPGDVLTISAGWPEYGYHSAPWRARSPVRRVLPL